MSEEYLDEFGLNLDTNTWEGWFNTQLVWASKEPWTFIYYTLLLLSPFFCISAILSWNLSQQIQKQQRKRKKRGMETETDKTK